MNLLPTPVVSTLGLLLAVSVAAAADAPPPSNSQGERYLLRYQFKPGDTLRWDVEQHVRIRTTVAGTTQTAETNTRSLKVWKVTEVSADGRAKLVHSVQRVEMRQQHSGRAEVSYNSETDSEPPLGFQDVAKAVGVPLTVFTLDARGNTIDREDMHPRSTQAAQQMTLVLPEEPIAVGDVWYTPFEIHATAKDGTHKVLKARQKLTLEEVKSGIAVIAIESQTLSPVNDPMIEAQVVQGETHGKLRFDLHAGRVISQQSDVDKQVVGSVGEGSSMHYVSRFSERLNTEPVAATAARTAPPLIGPAPPPGAKPIPRSEQDNSPILPR